MQYHKVLEKNGFTLAEVLITLGVIGVVAALTLPSVISNYKEREYIVKLQKAYSTITQAFTAAIADYGTVDNWCERPINRTECSKKMSEIVQKYLNVVRICNTYDGKCFSKEYNNAWWGFDDYKGILVNDGIAFTLNAQPGDNYLNNWCKTTVTDFSASAYYNNCGYMYIDITGPKKKKKKGKDLFMFKIFKDGVRPIGLPTDGANYERFKDSCLNLSRGEICAGWAIINKNMDYFHCNDLDWYSKTSCKKK